MGEPLWVKVCGVTSPADAVLAAGAGADALGLNFHPASPRYVGGDRAAEVLAALPPHVAAVGVFVDVSLREAAERLGPLGRIHTVQTHGRQPEPGEASVYPFIPAFAVRDADSLRAVADYLDAWRRAGRPPAAVLVDGHAAGLHGGTGRTAPWGLLASFRPGVPVILAGGLTPENVAEAVRVVRPDAVDVASGVEFAPGRKDPDKVRRFLDNARAAAARLA